jgi:predicted nucleic acid-binding protein
VIVVDASVVLELLLQTPRARQVADRLFDDSHSLQAPHLLDLEVAQVLRRLVHSKAIAAPRATEALEDLAQLGIERHRHTPLLFRIWALRDALSAYDASYIALAEALDAPLLTCDARLSRAHGHGAAVELICI